MAAAALPPAASSSSSSSATPRFSFTSPRSLLSTPRSLLSTPRSLLTSASARWAASKEAKNELYDKLASSLHRSELRKLSRGQLRYRLRELGAARTEGEGLAFNALADAVLLWNALASLREETAEDHNSAVRALTDGGLAQDLVIKALLVTGVPFEELRGIKHKDAVGLLRRRLLRYTSRHEASRRETRLKNDLLQELFRGWCAARFVAHAGDIDQEAGAGWRGWGDVAGEDGAEDEDLPARPPLAADRPLHHRADPLRYGAGAAAPLAPAMDRDRPEDPSGGVSDQPAMPLLVSRGTLESKGAAAAAPDLGPEGEREREQARDSKFAALDADLAECLDSMPEQPGDRRPAGGAAARRDAKFDALDADLASCLDESHAEVAQSSPTAAAAPAPSRGPAAPSPAAAGAADLLWVEADEADEPAEGGAEAEAEAEVPAPSLGSAIDAYTRRRPGPGHGPHGPHGSQAEGAAGRRPVEDAGPALVSRC